MFRGLIINDRFIYSFRKNKIPISSDLNSLIILTDEATVTEWNSQKLPSDKVSTENGEILINSQKCSLIIDPKL
jgi:dynein heavy chain